MNAKQKFNVGDRVWATIAIPDEAREEAYAARVTKVLEDGTYECLLWEKSTRIFTADMLEAM